MLPFTLGWRPTHWPTAVYWEGRGAFCTNFSTVCSALPPCTIFIAKFIYRVSLIGLYGNQNATNQVEAKSDPVTDVGTTIFGQSRYYELSLDFPGSTGLSGIGILNKKFQLQDSLFVAYTLSSISPGLDALGINFKNPIVWTINITAAVSSPIITPLHTNLSYSSWSYLVPNDLSYSPIPHSNFRNSNSEAQHLEPNDRYFENLDPGTDWDCGTLYDIFRHYDDNRHRGQHSCSVCGYCWEEYQSKSRILQDLSPFLQWSA